MEFEEEDVSDGSDIEVEEDLNYLLEEENSLEEVRDQRVFNESEDIVRNIFASDSDSDEEFAGFQNAWYTNNGGHGGFIPRNTQPYRRHRGLTADTQQRLPSEPKAVDFFLMLLDKHHVAAVSPRDCSVCQPATNGEPPSSIFEVARSVRRRNENFRRPFYDDGHFAAAMQKRLLACAGEVLASTH